MSKRAPVCECSRDPVPAFPGCFSQVCPAMRTVSPVGQLKGRVRPARLHLRQFRAMRTWRFNCLANEVVLSGRHSYTRHSHD
jgi:hypothetical protein